MIRGTVRGDGGEFSCQVLMMVIMMVIKFMIVMMFMMVMVMVLMTMAMLGPADHKCG